MRRYRVTGGKEILGNKPGSVFTATLPESQEKRLMNLGHIEVVKDEPKPKAKPALTSKEDDKK